MNAYRGTNPINLGATVDKMKKWGVFIVILILAFVIAPIILTNLFETVSANQILVVQHPLGSISYHIRPGIKWQGGGTNTFYNKRDIYEFKIPIRFNDSGHGTLIGSVQYDMPIDSNNLSTIYTKFPSQEA